MMFMLRLVDDMTAVLRKNPGSSCSFERRHCADVGRGGVWRLVHETCVPAKGAAGTFDSDGWPACWWSLRTLHTSAQLHRHYDIETYLANIRFGQRTTMDDADGELLPSEGTTLNSLATDC